MHECMCGTCAGPKIVLEPRDHVHVQNLINKALTSGSTSSKQEL